MYFLERLMWEMEITVCYMFCTQSFWWEFKRKCYDKIFNFLYDIIQVLIISDATSSELFVSFFVHEKKYRITEIWI